MKLISKISYTSYLHFKKVTSYTHLVVLVLVDDCIYHLSFVIMSKILSIFKTKSLRRDESLMKK